MNSTTTTLTVTDEGTIFFGVLTQTEVVIVGAMTAVIILAVLAVILRLIMPKIRKKYGADNRTSTPKPIVELNTGKLLPPGTPSSSRSTSSSRSSFTRSSNHGDWSDASSYRTKSTYYSQNSLHPAKSTSFGNLRAHSANASPASYRSKITEGLNEDLISMISQQSSVLEPLNLGEQYRRNWETHRSDNLATEKLGHPAPAEAVVAIPEHYNTLPLRHHVAKSTIFDVRKYPVIPVYHEHTHL